MSETAPFTLVQKLGDVEIRRYAPYLAAKTSVTETRDKATEAGFDILAGFIFGGNDRKEKISMTSPVTQNANGASAGSDGTSDAFSGRAPLVQASFGVRESYEMQFMMPHQYTRATLPTPNDSRVEIVDVPARTVAVVSYHGRWTEELYQDKLATLRAELEKNSIAVKNGPQWARYNSPMMPFFLRHNEIWVEIER